MQGDNELLARLQLQRIQKHGGCSRSKLASKESIMVLPTKKIRSSPTPAVRRLALAKALVMKNHFADPGFRHPSWNDGAAPQQQHAATRQ
jgi:hypothetical protein